MAIHQKENPSQSLIRTLLFLVAVESLAGLDAQFTGLDLFLNKTHRLEQRFVLPAWVGIKKIHQHEL